MGPLTEYFFIDPDTARLTAAQPADCSIFSATCRSYNSWILATLVFGIIMATLCAVVLAFTFYGGYKKKKVARQQHLQHQRSTSQILPLYLNSNQDGGTRGTEADEGVQLRRLSRRVSIPLPLHVQHQPSGMTAQTQGGIDTAGLDVSRRSVGSNDTVVRHDLPQARIPRAAVRCESVETLPRYEEVEFEVYGQRRSLLGELDGRCEGTDSYS